MKKPDNKPENLCLAPWYHTFLSPITERRMCCASREPAQSFEQYIDTEAGTGVYNPISLEEHWNSEHMKSVRVRMMAGETLSECDVCNNKLLNTDVYRSYFEHLFNHRYDEIWEKTDEDGATTCDVLSWDYRFSNLCNFKCRMCGDMLSSAWETEARTNNMINFDDPQNNWMKKDVRKQISKFQDTVIEKEFSDAVEAHNIEEIYWVGGEPLMFEQHWKYMKRIIELGDGQKVYTRYNTNLSQIEYKGINLYTDILPHIRDWQICASIDGTGEVGEYIRTGLKWHTFLDNFKQGLTIAHNSRQMRLDFTLTLPGLFELKNMFNLSKQLNSTVLAKVTFAFSPNILMSPLALPKNILHNIVNEFLEYANKEGYDQNQKPLIDVMTNILSRPTFEDEWPDGYKQGAIDGKARILKVEAIRQASCTFEDILRAENADAHSWWENIQ